MDQPKIQNVYEKFWNLLISMFYVLAYNRAKIAKQCRIREYTRT